MKPILFKTFYTIILSSSLLLQTGCKKKPTIQPKRMHLVDAVFATGSIIPKNQYAVVASTEAYLRESLVVEGDTVEKGGILFKLENDIAQIQHQNAKENLNMASRDRQPDSPVLSQLCIQLQAAREQMLTDSLNTSRYAALVKTKAVSSVDYERIGSVYRNSLANYQALQETYVNTRNELQLQYENARSQVLTHEQMLADYVLYSQINGKVYNVYKKPGELVRKGELLATLGDKENMLIELSVAEEDIGKISLGQQVLLEIGTQKGRIYQAAVSKIYPAFDLQAQAYKLEASFPEPIPSLYAGTLLEANIIIQQKANALVIPRESLKVQNRVMLESGKEITIQTGIQTTEWVEVLSGISESDLLVASENQDKP